MASPPLEPHVVIFPFMAHGHTLPLLDLSKALRHRNIAVTILTTPSNAASISRHLSSSSDITLTSLPFPYNLKGIENTSQLPSMDLWFPFALATRSLQKPFEDFMQAMHDANSLPICVISDFFLGWTLESCRKFDVARLVFHGMGVLSMAICKSIIIHRPHLKAKTIYDPLGLPDMKLPFDLNTSELPETLSQLPEEDDVDDPMFRFMFEAGEADVESWGVVVNSFTELEGGSVSSLESFYRKGARAWCVGPLSFYDDNDVEKKGEGVVVVRDWLDEQVTPGSVIYVSFGTQADLSDVQLDEVVFGLEEAGVPFVLVVKSTKWAPPNGVEERLNGKGLIIRDWVDQRKILAHQATGGFLSHCGWNSVIESISAGVPILAWPMMAEQSLNAKLVADGLGAGLAIRKENAHHPKGSLGFEVSRQAICEGVLELMLGGEKGRNAKERAQALGRVAWRAVQQGGSSYQALDELIQKLTGISNSS